MISFKKILAVALVSAIVTFAQNTDWYTANSEKDTFYISTEEDIKGLAQLANNETTDFNGKTIILSNDITLSAPHTPIGDNSGNTFTSTKRFNGTFDGGGHSISNVSVSNVSSNFGPYLWDYVYAGFFGSVGNNGQIKNLVVNVTNIQARAPNGGCYVGGLAGSYGSTKPIENCGVNISGSISTSSWSNSGGLVGTGNGITINNSYTTGNISVSALSKASDNFELSISGGLVGEGRGITINNSYATGNVSASNSIEHGGSISGGLVGHGDTITINDSYTTGNVSASSAFSHSYSGGLVGEGRGITINNSYATGNVSASNSNPNPNPSAFSSSWATISGGLVGYLEGNESKTINNSYTTGDVSASNSSSSSRYVSVYSGGLVGQIASDAIMINNSYTTGNVSASNVSVSNYYGASFSGGLVGEGYVTINNSYTTGDVSASSSTAYSGGLVGRANIVITINNSYTTGDVSASSSTAYSGGLVGFSSSFGIIIIKYCYASGTVTATGSGAKYIGGIFGRHYADYDYSGNYGSLICTSVYYNSAGASDAMGSGNRTGITGLTTAQLKDKNSFIDWDFESIWAIAANKNNGYPYLYPREFVKVSDISGIPTSATHNQPIILNATVSPENANNKNIVWSVVNSTQRTIANGNVFTPLTTGQIQIKATIVNGLGEESDYEKIFTINVSDGNTPIGNNKHSDKKHGILLDGGVVSQEEAKIKVITPEQAQINLAVYDNLGNVIFEKSGVKNDKEILWNLTNAAGRNVANGSYLIVVEAKGISGKVYRYQAKIGVRR